MQAALRLFWRLVNQSNVLHVDIFPITCHNLEFTSSFHYERRRSVSSVCKICAILFCINLFFGSPLCLIMEKMNERSYSDAVSGNGKFIFAVSTGYLFGVCCNLCASDFTRPREIVCLSGSSDSDPVVIFHFWMAWLYEQFIPAQRDTRVTWWWSCYIASVGNTLLFYARTRTLLLRETRNSGR